MALKSVKKSWGNNKNVNYLGKDFDALKQNLIDFTKTYFPNQYSDFNDASPGMVFIEQAAALGDVLSFYQDVQLKESMLANATERKNVIALAQSMGYKPKITTPAVTTLTIYQLVPSIGTGINNIPDEKVYFVFADFELKENLENKGITIYNIKTTVKEIKRLTEEKQLNVSHSNLNNAKNITLLFNWIKTFIKQI